MHTLDQSLTALADKVGVGIDRLYPALLAQAYVARVESLILLLILIAAPFGVRWTWRWAQRREAENWDEIVYMIPVAAAIFTVIFFLACFAELSTYAAAWYNPDGWVALKILRSVK